MRSTSPATPAVDRLRPYTLLNASQRRRDVWKRRGEGAAVATCTAVLALLLSRSPVTDIEVTAAVAADTERLALASDLDTEPCWKRLPMRKAITQENINRLCVNTPGQSEPTVPPPQPTPGR